MRITYLKIQNFKSIRNLEIHDIENALILVGKNNTGKTAAIDALLLVSGQKKVQDNEFLNPDHPIEITVKVEYDEEDLYYYYQRSILSKARDYETWLTEVHDKLPSFQDGILSFTYKISPQLNVRYSDGHQKNNHYIQEFFPRMYHIDQNRNLEALQNDVFSFYDKESFRPLLSLHRHDQ